MNLKTIAITESISSYEEIKKNLKASFSNDEKTMLANQS